MKDKTIVSGVGCCLIDLLYNHIDFSSPQIRPFLSRTSGDGGLSPGKLVLLEDFERFSHMPLDDFMHAILHDPVVDKINIGGPSIVSLIHAAQVAGIKNYEVRFYGKAGKDIQGKYLESTEGTLIHLSYEMFPATKRLLLFWTVLTLLITAFFVGLHQAWLYGAISFGFCLVNYILSRANFRNQVRKSRRMVEKMLS